MTGGRRILELMLRATVVLAAVVAAALAAIYGAVQTEIGREGVARAVERALGSSGGTTVAIEGLGPGLPGRVTVRRLVLGDTDGVWLEAADVVVDWRPLSLLSGKINIESFTAARVRVLRRPGDAGPPSGGVDPRLLLDTRVGALRLDSVRLETPVLGKAIGLRATGALGSRDRSEVRTSLSIERTDGAAGRIQAHVVYRPDDRMLTVDTTIAEPKGGLLAALLDFPGRPAIELELRGAGPVADWRGRLELAINDVATASADLRLAGEDSIDIRASGSADIAPLLGPPFGRLAAPTLAIDLATRWNPGEATLRVHRARFASAAGVLSGEGRLDIETLAIRGKAALDVKDVSRVNPVLAPATLAGANATIAIDGTLDRPRLSATLGWRGLRVPGVMAADGSATVTGRPGFARPATPWDITADTELRSLRLEDPILADIVGRSATVRLRGRAAMDTGRVEDATLEATAGPVALRGSGAGNVADATGTADLTLSVGDLATLARHLPGPVGGRLDVRARLAADREKIDARIDAGAAGLALDSSVMDALLGPAPRLSGRLRRRHDGRVDVSEATLAGAAVKAALDATLSSTGRVEGRYRIDLPDLSTPAAAAALPARGAVAVEGTINGPLVDPGLEGAVSGSALGWGAAKVGRTNGRFAITGAVTRPRGSVSFSTDAPVGKLDTATRFDVVGWERLVLSGLSIDFAGATLSGELTVPLDGGPLTGVLSGQTDTLGHVAKLAGLDADGKANYALRLAPNAAKQGAAIRFEGRDVAVGRAATIASVVATASSDDVGRLAPTEFELTANGVGGAFGTVSRLTLSGGGTAESLRGSFGAKGDVRGTLDLSGELVVKRTGASRLFTLNDLRGTAAGHPVRMIGSARLAINATAVELAVPSLSWAGGNIIADARLAPNSVSARLRAADLSAGVLSVMVPRFQTSGRIGLDARIEGDPARPTGDLHLTLTAVKIKDAATVDLPALDGTIEGRFAKGRLGLHGRVSGIGAAVLEADADLPVAIDGRTFSVSVPVTAPATGTVSWRGDVEGIAPLLPIAGHLVKGEIALAMRLEGTVAAPRVTGETAWTGGVYENLRTGTILREIDLSVAADGERIAIRRGTATDGNGGSVSMSGSVALDRGVLRGIDVTTQFRKFTALRRDELTATGSGTVRLQGGSGGLNLTGRIDTGVVEARVVESLPPEIVEIDIVDTDGGPSADAERSVSDAGKRVPPVALEVEVAMARRVFLRGRGLDSEWSGQLRVSGTAENPVVKGELLPVRGRFDLAGKVFTLGQGRVTFEGTEKVDPTLDITAEHRAKQITATVRITGTASRPKITLSSVPDLPQDEILARVLFDKEVGRLTIGEAAQLANTLATLTAAYGGGAGILDRVRQTIGVDTLRVGKDEEGTPTVGVGKYLTEDVYVGIDQGTTQNSSNVTVELSIIPNVTIKSDVGADARSRVGINWKWDY